jgi:hypothetical protein
LDRLVSPAVRRGGLCQLLERAFGQRGEPRPFRLQPVVKLRRRGVDALEERALVKRDRLPSRGRIGREARELQGIDRDPGVFQSY